MAGNETVDISVGEIAAPIKNSLVGGPFGSDLGTADYMPSGVPVIRGQNLSNGKFVGGEFVFVSEEKADKLKSNLARPGDLVFTQRGNAVLHGGQVAIVPDQPFERYLVSQSQMKLTPDQTKVESRFLYFIFTSADYRHYLRSNAVVTGVPHINLGLLREYSLSLPSLAEQKAIAAVLGALDDKIELNRRMNATLEALARALFQSWFVDFDPVRAKLDGRKPPGLNPATAALFPATFQESALGHIPKGWETGSILRQADLLSGGTPKTDVPGYWNGDVPWASAKDVSQCGEAFLVSTRANDHQAGCRRMLHEDHPAVGDRRCRARRDDRKTENLRPFDGDESDLLRPALTGWRSLRALLQRPPFHRTARPRRTRLDLRHDHDEHL